MEMNSFTAWFYALIIFLVLGWACFAYDTTTNNLLNQDFTNNSWSGTNQSSRHGNSTIAGVDSKYVESTISLRDTLTQEQINGGFKSTLGADIWFWNNREQSVVMKQTIGGVTQTRIVDRADGYYNTYTDTIIVNENLVTDYDVNVKFEFNESGNSSYHYAADLKNPTLAVNYWDNPVKPDVIEDLEEVIEDIPQFIEPELPIETNVPIVIFEPMEEFVVNPNIPDTIIEEPQDSIEKDFEDEQIFESFGGPEIVEEPMPDEPTEPDNTVAMDSFTDEALPMEMPSDEPTNEFTSTSEVAETPIESESVMEDEPVETESAKVEEVDEEPEVESSIAQKEEVVEEEPVAKKEEVVEEETPTVAKEETVEEGSVVKEEPKEVVADKPKIKEFSVDVADVEAHVKSKVKSVEQQLQAISIIAAKAMVKNEVNLNQYTNKNQQMFDNRKIYNNNNYNDVVLLDSYMIDIYANDNRIAQITMNDPVLKYQNDLREATFKRQQAERELRKLRGF